MKKLKPLMIAGTASAVGKSSIVAALCQRLIKDGYNPAPFKAINLTSSSVQKHNLPVGKSIALQAEAAGIRLETAMNPILITRDKYFLLGQEQETAPRFEELQNTVYRAYDEVHAKYNPVILEGSGSIAELNFRDKDIGNTLIASYSKANIILVANVDKGGVFASLYGTIQLLDEDLKNSVIGIIINQLKGDTKHFQSAVEIIERICKVPVLGIVPHIEGNMNEEIMEHIDMEKIYKIIKAT